MPRRRILVIADALSEVGAFAGRHRIEGLCKAWARLGHEVHVLTPGPVVPWLVEGCVYHTRTTALMAVWRRYPRLYWLRRRIIGRLLRSVCFPDKSIPWYRPALRQADRLVQGLGGFDLVFSSFSSATCHVIGAAVAERHRLRWIADYRDIWTDNVYHPPDRVPLYLYGGRQPSRRAWKRHRALEQRILGRAACVTTIAEPLARVLREKVSPTVPVRVVPNGYDCEHLAPDPDPGEAFVISYTGKLNTSADHYELRLFLRSLRVLRGVFPRLDLEIRFQYRGRQHELVRRLCATEAPEIPADVGPTCPFRECVAIQRGATMLLLMLPVRGDRSSGVSSRKLFDYLAARRPILGIVPAGSHAAEILEETEAGVVVTDEAALVRVLSSGLREFLHKGRIRYCGNEAALREYTFSRLAPRVLAAADEPAEEPVR